MNKFYYIIIIIFFLISSCKQEVMSNELMDQQEYSILQSFEYKYRSKNNNEKYIINRNALNSEVDVIALPIMGKTEGYVVIIAQSKSGTQIKVMPNVDFNLSHETLKKIQTTIALSSSVDAYLISHVR